MASSTHYFSGPCRWAKILTPDKDYGHYSLELQLDAEQQERFKTLGLKNKIKEDGYISLRRRPDQMAWKNGKQELAGAPRVVDSHGHVLAELVGNGSIVTVELMVYDYNHPKHGKGRGSRLEAVRVDSLVKYERQADDVAYRNAGQGNPGPASVPANRRLF